MPIDHEAPKDLGWAEKAVKDLDTRLTALEKERDDKKPKEEKK